tara:strand:- start:66 stop:530 length:465 start_codon:yes stop_codon:yes gene_type:complete
MSNSSYRPLYETAADLKHEQKLASRIEQGFAWSLRKMSRKYYLDFMAFRPSGPAVAVIEVKRRHNPHNRYETVILSLAKYMKGAEYYNVLGLKFLFIVEFDNGCFKYEYKHGDATQLSIITGGRKDRNDPQDIEPVIHIPVHGMTPLFDTGGIQ